MADYLVRGWSIVNSQRVNVLSKIYTAADGLSAIDLAQVDPIWSDKDLPGDEVYTVEEISAAGGGVGASANWYSEDDAGTALTVAFVQQAFGFTSIAFNITNDDAADWIEWSWDGVNPAGRLQLGEVFAGEMVQHTGIYLRGQNAGSDYRVWAW